ncbi:MAG TPA: hypothetical protein VFC39_21195 [Acidobacteriaceae bacterium]|nr:hypothetical protein [Acidobacteriaceae bacterium]
MIVVFGLGLQMLLTGCGSSTVRVQTITNVTPSSTGTPLSVTSLGSFEFVSVQGTGQIFSYNISSGSQVLAAQPYATPCSEPSGMVIANIAGNSIMAVVCYDTGVLLTLTVHGDGSLTALGSVAGIPSPYPGIALDGTNVFVPLFGVSNSSNGGVAKVSIASPANPVLTGLAPLARPPSGGYANPGYLTVAGGNIFVAAGSESGPQTTSSTIQVMSEATLTLIGSPLVVAHSPQHLTVHGNTAFVTFYDATQLESIDVSNAAALKPLQILSLTATAATCHAIPLIVSGDNVYVGCYDESMIDRFDVTNPAAMVLMQTTPGISTPQEFNAADGYLLVTDSAQGGHVYQIPIGITLSGKI